jgi:hypothetical protein
MKTSIALAVAMSLAGLGSTSLAAFQVTTQPVTRPAPERPVPLPQPVPDRPVIQPPRPQPPRPQPPRPPRPEIQPPRPIPPRPIPPRPPRPPVVVNPGFGAGILYARTGYRGNYLTVRRSIPDLRRYGFNDRGASLRGRGRWQVCARTNYRGPCITVRAPEPSFGRLNGEISSIRYLGR